MFEKRSYWKLLLAGVVLAGIAGGGASEAEAGWYWDGCRPVCWTPCYTPCLTVTCNPCGDVCCPPWGYQRGPIRHLAHSLVYGRPIYRWSNPCCYVDPCCCVDVCGCGSDEAVGSLDVPTDATPTEAAPAVEPDPDAPLPGPASGGPPDPRQGTQATFGTTILPVSNPATPATSGLLTIWVPFDAKVTINGHETTSTGSQREYMSNNLRPGFTYNYEIHAQIVRDGRVIEEVRAVSLRAGGRKGVAFGFNQPEVEQVAWIW